MASRRPRCKACGVAMRKTSYRVCEDCGADSGRARKCPYCGGKVHAQEYWSCPSCGQVR